jgi:hypothetical protein
VIGPLRHARAVDRGRPLLLVEVNVEVLGGEHRIVEVLVLDVVLAERLGAGRRGASEHEGGVEGAEPGEKPRPHHYFPAPTDTSGASAHRRSSW